MPKAQVLVTVTAEAFVDVPDGVQDVERYVRDSVTLVWGDADASQVQAPAISVEYFLIPEPEQVISEPVEEAVEEAASEAEVQFSDTLPLPVSAASLVEAESVERPLDSVVAIGSLLEDPSYRQILRTAVRSRATELLESVVDQVVGELEPLLRRHYNKDASGAI